MHGPSDLSAIAAAITDPNEKARLLSNTLNKVSSGGNHRLNANDFDIFSRQIAAMGFTGENATLVDNAIAAARNAKPGRGAIGVATSPHHP
jgi:hypothetical protein